MASQVIEGTWEEIKRREAELAGRHIRVTIRPEKSAEHRKASQEPASAAAIRKRLDALNAWFSLTRPVVTHEIDDSRMSIYDLDERR